jgi:uncharacterized protein YpuA (DUF1002 family)
VFGGSQQINIGATVSTAANQAQIATAATDANCTQSADLAGIYFAVQTSYEQQIVNENAQALNAAVQQYKAAYARELRKLPALLKTAKANAFPNAVPTSKG